MASACAFSFPRVDALFNEPVINFLARRLIPAQSGKPGKADGRHTGRNGRDPGDQTAD